MSRKFIAAILAGSIAITGLSFTPAQASDRDIVRFLAGATALVIIGKAISDDRNRRHEPQIVTRSHSRNEGYYSNRRPRPDYFSPDYNRHNTRPDPDRHHQHGKKYHHGKKHHHGKQYQTYKQPRPLPERARRAALPERCLQTFKTNQGWVRMYGRNCLAREFRMASELPRSCSQKLWTRSGNYHGYNPTCLSENGWMNRR